MGEQLFELRRRTFDTPHFRGIEFIEVESKSIINNVPGSYLPFNWTINPYRGCSHACHYCLQGDTPILMADGRTKPIAEVRAGDRIYGTVREGNYRRYVTTDVLAHWSTIKPAYRVTLEDGTALVASGDHRFLTGGGWKQVTADPTALSDHPFLNSNDVFQGTGVDGGNVLTRTRVGEKLQSHAGLRLVSIEPVAGELLMYDITTGTGDFIANGVVSHNCFARSTHTYLDMNAGRDFETKIVVKVNAPDLLRKELRAKKWKGERIAMGTATDPYQRAEGKYKLMRGILSALVEVGNPFSILTKGTLILRDLDLLVQGAEVTDVSCAFSIGTLDEDAWRKSEPGTPHPRKRMDAVRRLNEAGIPTGVMVAPILPGITDGIEQLKTVVSAAMGAGATHVSPILLHLRPKVKEVYMEWLGREYPHLLDRYEAMYAKGAYASNGAKNSLSDTVGELIRAYDGPRPEPLRTKSDTQRRKPPPEPEGEQLALL